LLATVQPLVRFHGNTKRLCIVDSHMQINKTKQKEGTVASVQQQW